MLDAHQLNVFLMAARTLNFTAAARQLHMTQPSVSQHIQVLEQHFGTRLFIRSGRHLRLTDSGKELMSMAQEMVSMSQRIDERMVSLKGEVHGHLVVGYTATVGKYVLPLLLSGFMKTHPKVSASCLVTARQVAVQRLCDGDVHLALASATEFCSDIEFVRLLTDPVVLITPKEHPWAEREAIQVEELLDADFIVREDGSGTRSVAEESLARAGISFDQLRTVLTLGNSEAIALAVQEGVGVAFISQMVVSRLVQGRVSQVPLAGLAMQQQISMGRSVSRPATTAQSAFWDFAIDQNNPIVRMLNAPASSEPRPAPQAAKDGGVHWRGD
jgi:DNA-binding transcriptional LysR family regulator